MDISPFSIDQDSSPCQLRKSRTLLNQLQPNLIALVSDYKPAEQSPMRPQFLTYSQMMNQIQESTLIPEEETNSQQVATASDPSTSLMRSERLVEEDDLCYSRSNFYDDRLTKVEEHSDEQLSSVSELEDSVQSISTPEPKQNQRHIIETLSVVQSQLQNSGHAKFEAIIQDKDNKLNQQRKEITILKRQCLELQMQYQYRNDQIEEKMSEDQQKQQKEIQDLNKTLQLLQERYKSELLLKEEMLSQLQTENEQLQSDYENIQIKYTQQLNQLKRDQNEQKDLERCFVQFLSSHNSHPIHMDLKQELKLFEEKYQRELSEKKSLLDEVRELTNLNKNLQNQILEVKAQMNSANIFNTERQDILNELNKEVSLVKELRSSLNSIIKDLQDKKPQKSKELQEKLNEMSIQLLLERQDKSQQVSLLQKELMNAHQREMDLQKQINQKQQLLDEQSKTLFSQATEQNELRNSQSQTKLLLDLKKQQIMTSPNMSRPQSLNNSPKLSIYDRDKTLQSAFIQKELNKSPQGIFFRKNSSVEQSTASLIDQNIQKLMEKFKGAQLLNSRLRQK